MSADDLLFLVGGLLLVRYVAVPWIRTRVLGPPEVPLGWSMAARKHNFEPTFVRRGLKWAIAVRLPIGNEECVDLEAHTTSGGAISGMNAAFRRRAALPPEAADSKTELVIDARGRIPNALVVRPISKSEAEDARRDRTAMGRDTDDLQHLRDTVSIAGNDALVTALLDEETRTLLRVSVHELGFNIEDGFIRFVASNLESSHLYLEQIVTRMIAVVRALTIDEGDVFARLERIALFDHCPEARAHALMVMAFSFPKDRSRPVFERARIDPFPIVRLQVISTVTSRIEEIIGVLTDPLATRATLKEAIRVAVRRFRRREVVVALVKLFQEQRREQTTLRSILIEALGRLRAGELAPELAALTRDDHDATREAATRALGMIGGSAFEVELIARLDDRDAGVTRAAIYALGQCGTIAAISPLRALIAPKRLIDQMVGRIVARHGQPHAGTLALAGAGGGELAFADEQQGALSEYSETA